MVHFPFYLPCHCLSPDLDTSPPSPVTYFLNGPIICHSHFIKAKKKREILQFAKGLIAKCSGPLQHCRSALEIIILHKGHSSTDTNFSKPFLTLPNLSNWSALVHCENHENSYKEIYDEYHQSYRA